MSAIASAKALSRRAAGAPSMIWWSTVSESPIRCSSTSVPSGPGRGARHDRVHAQDRDLRRVEHGVKDSMPKAPRFVTVKVPPESSSGLIVAGLAGRREPLRLGRNLAQRKEVGVPDDRHHEAARRIDREARDGLARRSAAYRSRGSRSVGKRGSTRDAAKRTRSPIVTSARPRAVSLALNRARRARDALGLRRVEGELGGAREEARILSDMILRMPFSGVSV